MSISQHLLIGKNKKPQLLIMKQTWLLFDYENNLFFFCTSCSIAVDDQPAISSEQLRRILEEEPIGKQVSNVNCMPLVISIGCIKC